MKNHKDIRLAVVGLGYVGLPLALAFAKNRQVIGFDINKTRIDQLNNGKDKNLEFNNKKIKSAKLLKFTSNSNDLNSSNCYIVTVPTPINSKKNLI